MTTQLNLQITKTDSADTKKTLEGAKFTLKEQGTENSMEVTTGKDGIALFSGIILTGMGAILGATEMFYDPVILWKPLNGLAAASAVGYAFLCLLPLGLELWTEYRFERLRRTA